jgi:hypothetical protein
VATAVASDTNACTVPLRAGQRTTPFCRRVRAVMGLIATMTFSLRIEEKICRITATLKYLTTIERP